MCRAVVVAAVLVASASWAQTWGPALVGAPSTVNNLPGNQFDPHVSGELVAYTEEVSATSRIRYHSLLDGWDRAIPNGGAFDFLSDVNGNRIVFTRKVGAGSGIWLFDAVTEADPQPLVPDSSVLRQGAAIGGDTVAWEELSLGNSDVAAHVLGTASAVRLTEDAELDFGPAVAPQGGTVVWTRCDALGAHCDIWQASLAGGSWTRFALTGAGSEETQADTNGSLVVYATSTDGGDSDLAWVPAGGGAEQRLSLSGGDSNPAISGELIAFEHVDPAVGTSDILLYHLPSHTLYRLTQTPALNESLTDLSVAADGLARVVWTVLEGDLNVYGFSFRLQSGCSSHVPTCADPGAAPTLVQLSLTRESGGKVAAVEHFAATPGTGLLCVESDGGTAAWVVSNAVQALSPNDFKQRVRTIEQPLQLGEQNVLAAALAGEPGTSLTLTVYGAEPNACQAGTSTLSHGALRLSGKKAQVVRALQGERGTVQAMHDWAGMYCGVGQLLQGGGELGEPGEGPRGGCASTGDMSLSLGALALALLWLGRKRGQATFPV